MISNCTTHRYEVCVATCETETEPVHDNGRQDAREAAQHGKAALAHTGGAVVNTVVSAGGAVYGTVQTVKSAAHLAAAASLTVAGAKAWLGEKLASGVRTVAEGFTRGFAAVANFFGRAAGETERLRVRETHAPASKESDFLFGEAKKQTQKSSTALGSAGRAYVGSAAHAVSAGVNVVAAGGHTLAAAGNAVQAAAKNRPYGQAEVCPSPSRQR
ncbi:MAG: hypothetical protein JNK82_35180 [Myxococcaceae bacterium]|nr:hypothetical protein [Myxococcaceae bacterium]